MLARYTSAPCTSEHVSNQGHHGNVQDFIPSVLTSRESMASFIASPSCWVYLPSARLRRNLHSGGKVAPGPLAQAAENDSVWGTDFFLWASWAHSSLDHYILLLPTSSHPQPSRCSLAPTLHREWHVAFQGTLGRTTAPPRVAENHTILPVKGQGCVLNHAFRLTAENTLQQLVCERAGSMRTRISLRSSNLIKPLPAFSAAIWSQRRATRARTPES